MRHHLDRRIDQISSSPCAAGSDDDLLTTKEMARWLGVSVQWLETGRMKGWGPPFLKLGPKMIRYHRGSGRQWLQSREALTA
jgi:predicted DNA-binding transcriptional regulator AlpA